MKKFSSLFITAAGMLWGTMGLFVRQLSAWGFNSIQTTALRLVFGAALLWLLLLITGKAKTRVALRDLPLLAAIGIISLLTMSLLYFITINRTSLSIAAILLYLSPVMVMLMSALFLKERITRRKLLALALAVFGCALVSGILGSSGISAAGLLTGIGSAVAYGSYSILGTFALRKYEPLVVTAWGFTFAAAGSLLFANIPGIPGAISACPVPAWQLLLFLLLTALVTAAMPYWLYTSGLKYTEASRAAIIACVEPLVAALCGIIFYQENLGPSGIAGIVLILGAIVLLNTAPKKECIRHAA